MPRPSIALPGLCPRRVCWIKPSALGDVTNAFPTLAALRDLWPSAHFSWVINQNLRGLVDGHPLIDEIIPFDRQGIRPTAKGLIDAGRFLRTLRTRRFDLTIDLQGLLRSGLMTAATGAPVRVGLADAREGATRFYTHRVPMTEQHAVDRLLTVARAFGADTSHPRFVAAMTEEDRHWAKTVLADCSFPRLILNVGARWVTKRWPPEHFAAIARRAVEEFGASLIAVGAPEDRPLVDALRASLHPRPVLDLCGATTLPRLAALAANCDLVLSNDTGPLHLATAAGARVVGVYTCTSPDLNGPYGPRAAAVRSRVWCAGSYLQKCDRMECMSELTPAKVWPTVRELLRICVSDRQSAA